MTNVTSVTPAKASPDEAIHHWLLTQLREHGPEWLPDVRDPQAAARALARVEQVLLALAAGATLEDALAWRRGARSVAPKVVVVTDDDILELRDLAAQSQEHHAHVRASLRRRRPVLLGRADDKAGMGRSLDDAEARAEGAERAAAREFATYSTLLDEGPMVPSPAGRP